MKFEKNMEISFKPSSVHIAEIDIWLKEEEKKSHKGFYCNWNVIQSAYKGRMAVILVDKKSIGFLIWHTSGQAATIDIMEIHPLFRRQGYGRSLIENVSKYSWNTEYLLLNWSASPQLPKRHGEKWGL